jgi:AraC family transcriptional regulator, alkane utilization regulator
MDLLSTIMSGIRLQSSLLASLSLSPSWSIDFEEGSGSPAYYLSAGELWLSSENQPPRRILAGDLLMFPRWTRHVLSSEPGLPARTIREVARIANAEIWIPGTLLEQPTRIVYGGGGNARTELLSMVFRMDSPEQDPLMLCLPRCIHIRGDDARMAPWIQPAIQFLTEESAARRLGYAMVASRLADLLFMQIIRAYVLLRPDEISGWLKGLSDVAIGRALAAMHERPGDHWTVASLARTAGLSRSGFAARFSSTMEITPLDYLTRFRMGIAADRLAHGSPVKPLANELGYATTFAFAKAFKRWRGQTPGVYARAFRTQR